MSPETWDSLAVQMPALLLFIIYLIYTDRTRQRSVQENHGEWRAWLKAREENVQAWLAEQSRIWRSWIEERDKAHVEAMRKAADDRAEERREMMATIKHLDQQTGQLIEMLRRRGGGGE